MLRFIRRVLGSSSARLDQSEDFDAAAYWETRYAAGGTSGDGSFGVLADFKAHVINDFVELHGIRSVVEFGCGDGNQLSLMRFPVYIGLDVSASALERCIERFQDDPTKSFFRYDPAAFSDAQGLFRAELALSLDVIYHLVSDTDFSMYMQHLCDSAGRFLIIYSTDTDAIEASHVRHRPITRWMQSNRADLGLMETVSNPYPGTGSQQSNASFFFYERIS